MRPVMLPKMGYWLFPPPLVFRAGCRRQHGFGNPSENMDFLLRHASPVEKLVQARHQFLGRSGVTVEDALNVGAKA